MANEEKSDFELHFLLSNNRTFLYNATITWFLLGNFFSHELCFVGAGFVIALILKSLISQSIEVCCE